MTTVAVVGLGYVGLPLAIEFGKHFDTIGFDVLKAKVDRLQQHNDVTGEVERGDFDLKEEKQYDGRSDRRPSGIDGDGPQ